MKRNLFITVLLLLSGIAAQAQNGILRGRVISKTDGNGVEKATVSLGSALAKETDLEGRFEFTELPAGNYQLVVSHVSFGSDTQQISIVAGEVTNADVVLTTRASGRVKVTGNRRAQKNPETVGALLARQKTAVAVSDGIPAELMRVQPVKSAADALRKISGTTMQDNKFAVIRGLSDRYNFALINGAPLPSSEADRKAFSFDLIPANLLDNMIIYKTATPDMPGEFAGGLIAISTRDIPEENFRSISASAGYNTLTTMQETYRYSGGKFDFLGIDNGKRSIPDGVLGTDEYLNLKTRQLIQQSKLFNGDFSSRRIASTAPNTSFQYSLGQKFRLFGAESGSLFAVTYNNSWNYKEINLKDYASNELIYDYTDRQTSRNVLWGSLFNIAMKLDKFNRISWKNTFNVNSEDQTIRRTGTDINASTDRRVSAFFFQQNIMFTTQINGEHFVPATRGRLKWVGGMSKVARNTPDFRRITYLKPQGSSESEYEAFITTNASPNDGGRFYSKLNENVFNLSYDYTQPNIIKKGSMATDLKVGGFHQWRGRVFDARVLGYAIARSSLFNQQYLKLPEDQIFSSNHIDSNGFVIKESTNKSDAYTASSSLQSGFAMLDHKFGEKFRLTWGARAEFFNQQLHSYQNGPVEVKVSKLDILPSANFTWSISKLSNLRIAGSRTLSRPEFRELAPFSFFDFARFIEIVGNNNLKRTSINNFDIRWESYPEDGQIYAITAFYKQFSNPIEQVLNADIGAGTLATTYANAKSAVNYGVELELRRKLGSLLPGSKLMQKLTVNASIALIKSQVDVTNIAGAAKRPLQGQSPYVINTGLTYNHLGWVVNASVNRVGRRIVFVGTDVYPDFYENPRTVVDFQITRSISKKLELRLSGSDVLAQRLIYYQNPVGNTNTAMESTDRIMRNTRLGSTYSFGLSFKF